MSIRYIGPAGLKFRVQIVCSTNLKRDVQELRNLINGFGDSCKYLEVDSEYSKKSSGRTKKSETKKIKRKV